MTYKNKQDIVVNGFFGNKFRSISFPKFFCISVDCVIINIGDDVMNSKEWSKEHQKLIAEEKRLIKSREREKISPLNRTAEKYLPDGLQNKLEAAFEKGFDLVFDKGAGVIEKTCRKSEREREYRINRYTMEEKDKGSLSGFRKSVNRSGRKNILLSGAEGAVFGILGIGLPDIPVFIAMLIKSVQEISLSYGFSYDSEEERIFMLKLIRTAISYGNAFISENLSVGKSICHQKREIKSIEEEISLTASALSDRLLYMKFVQGIPIVGMIGGMSDFTVMKEITKYARFAYKKRFLRNLWEEMRVEA